MEPVRGSRGSDFAKQILETTRPFRKKLDAELRILDVGSGYGQTTVALARSAAKVVGIEPSSTLYSSSNLLLEREGLSNLEFRLGDVMSLSESACYDLVVLDNVFEHISDRAAALQVISRVLAPDGVLFLLTPNRLWPVEAHYGLPFLSYLPVPLANQYLRWTGRGQDYSDASYAPTFWGLNRMLDSIEGWSYSYELPADLRLTTLGDAWHYKLGASLISRFPSLWAFSKSLLVIAIKDAR